MPALFDHPVFGRGFRPFFILGALYAIATVLLWVLQMRGVFFLRIPFDDPALWHAHEMIYGFTVAVIAGFMLTAVANWTGMETTKHAGLAVLCALWLAGRIASNIAGLPYVLSAAIDLAFLPVLTILLCVPLFRGRNRHNFIFLVMLGALFFCDLYLWVYQDRKAAHIALIVIMIMISAIGGRIIPSFTVAGLRRKGLAVNQTDQRKTDMAALVLLTGLALSAVFTGIDSALSGGLAFLAAVVHGWRHRHYHFSRVWNDPMLWSLHAGHLWLIAGLALIGGASSGFVPLSPALHALTVGAIGTLTLSMMCRVAFGHTGREIKAGSGTTFAFILMQAAALTRVAGPVFFPDHYMLWIEWSGGAWAVAFLIYIFAYMPVLWRPRPDGLPA